LEKAAYSEKRIPLKKTASGELQPLTRTAVPKDYGAMVAAVLTRTFAEGLKHFATVKKNPKFEVGGTIWQDEIVLTVSLMSDGQLSATSVHASLNFDPKASSPKAEELLATAVDAAGGFFGQFLDPSRPELIDQLARESLSSFDEAPFDWTETEIGKRRVWIKVDRANPKLDALADEWLEKAEKNKKH
jgi:hypothetical protein